MNVRPAATLAIISLLCACSSPTGVPANDAGARVDARPYVDAHARDAATTTQSGGKKDAGMADAAACPDGLTSCAIGFACVDLATSTIDCGNCVTGCAPGDVCTRGACCHPGEPCATPDGGIGNKIVLFGGGWAAGDGGGNDLGDTWTWDGTKWVEQHVPGPSARVYAAMAAQNSSIVLFGGEDSASLSLGDTWRWDGATWTVMNVAGPVDLGAPAAAALDGGVVLFGFGADYSDASMDDFPDETWTLRGAAWTQQQANEPSWRDSTMMAAIGNAVMLFGGSSSPGYLGDTWTWTAGSWSQQAVRGPSPRAFAAMTTLNNTAVLFGGLVLAETIGGDASACVEDCVAFAVGDTWTWDGVSWTQRNVSGPSARVNASMAALDGVVVLFGGIAADGTTLLGDTWTWDGTSWTQLDVSGPSARAGAAMSGP